MQAEVVSTCKTNADVSNESLNTASEQAEVVSNIRNTAPRLAQYHGGA